MYQDTSNVSVSFLYNNTLTLIVVSDQTFLFLEEGSWVASFLSSDTEELSFSTSIQWRACWGELTPLLINTEQGDPSARVNSFFNDHDSNVSDSLKVFFFTIIRTLEQLTTLIACTVGNNQPMVAVWHIHKLVWYLPSYIFSMWTQVLA